MRERIKCKLHEKNGSSIVSVMVAFVILMIGIAGFYASITVARDMMNRAESLSEATGVVVERFYSDIDSSSPLDAASYYEFAVSEKSSGANVFSLQGVPLEAQLVATPDGGEAADSITFNMYYYRRLK